MRLRNRTRGNVALHRSAAGLAEWTPLVDSRSPVERQDALGGRLLQLVALVDVCRRNDIALFIFREGKQPVHVIHLLLGHPALSRCHSAISARRWVAGHNGHDYMHKRDGQVSQRSFTRRRGDGGIGFG